MDISENISDYCRVCLEQLEAIQILDTNLIYDEDENLTYAECLLICTNINLAEDNDDLPHNLCKNCGLELQMAYDFYKKVEESKRLLQKFCQERNQLYVDEQQTVYEEPLESDVIEEITVQQIELATEPLETGADFVALDDKFQIVEEEYQIENMTNEEENDWIAAFEVKDPDTFDYEEERPEGERFKMNTPFSDLLSGSDVVENHAMSFDEIFLKVFEDIEDYPEKKNKTKYNKANTNECEDRFFSSNDYEQVDIKEEKPIKIESPLKHPLVETYQRSRISQADAQAQIKLRSSPVAVANENVFTTNQRKNIANTHITKLTMVDGYVTEEIIVNEEDMDTIGDVTESLIIEKAELLTSTHLEELNDEDSNIDYDEIEFIQEPISEVNEKVTETKVMTNTAIGDEEWLPSMRRKRTPTIKTGPPYKCEQCDYLSPSRSLLASHRHRKHRPILNNFKCHKCDKGFETEKKLTQHLKRPTCNLYPEFICEYCQKKIIGSSNYNIHLRFHKKQYPFVCHICAKSFMLAIHLTNHVKTKHENQRYVCEEPNCGKTFHTRHSLKLHNYVHSCTLPYQCEYCDKMFASKGRLRWHISKGHGYQLTLDDLDRMLVAENISVKAQFKTVLDDSNDEPLYEPV